MSTELDLFRGKLSCLDKAWGFTLDDPQGIPCGDGVYPFHESRFKEPPNVYQVLAALALILPDYDDDFEGEVLAVHVYRLAEWEFEVLIKVGEASLT